MTGRSRQRSRPRARRVLRTAGVGIALVVVAVVMLVVVEWCRLPDVDALLARATTSTVLLDRDGEPFRYRLAVDGRFCLRVPLAEIHPYLVEATIAAEDERFRVHPGVDPIAVSRAIWTNTTRGEIVSGASTITMQLARMLRPLPRSYYGKFREMVLAIWLERHLSKDGILELYLTLSPYGGNVHGVEAACRRYFGRSASDLSLSEAALIAGLPQSPSRYRPDRHPARARTRRDWILDRMQSLGCISPAERDRAKATDVHAGFHEQRLLAPHFAVWALGRSAAGQRVQTTLDPAVQELAENAVFLRLRDLEPNGADGTVTVNANGTVNSSVNHRIDNGAIVVAETASGKIRALVGSEDFFEPRRGQVNGATSPRSPGSLLKPFIYALAFQRNIAGPDTVLEDRPHSFRDGYDPRNFSDHFLGEVTAHEALTRSLNVPAVELLSRVGVGEAIRCLRRCGLRSVRRGADHYGLSLGLGGVEVTLLELVEAYATLARLGTYRPLSFREDGEPVAATRVLSERATRQVAEILEGAGWSDVERQGPLRLPRLALKTGTSFGFRDAWAIAYNRRWTVGVWFGNFDGRASESLVGRHAAAPAALGLMRQLCDSRRRDLEPDWYASVDEPATAPIAHPPPRLVRKLSGGVHWIWPADGAVLVRHDRSGGNTLRFLAETRPPQSLSWFLDGEFLGCSAPGEALETRLVSGRHRVTLVSDGGHSEMRTIVVR